MDYGFSLTGVMPLLMHADDVEAADALILWRKDPRNKAVSVAGDDRSPAWTWQSYLYSDGTNLVMPQENIMVALRDAGAKVPSKGKATFKSLSQSGLIIASDYCEFLVNGQPIPLDALLKFREEPFSKHKEEVRKLGFDLSIKRARVGTSKHVRVRARFDTWQVRGSLTVSEPAITQPILQQLFDIAGRLAGLGDWRPSSPSKPGPYGMFTAQIKPIR